MWATRIILGVYCLWTLPKATEMAKKTKMDKDDISTNQTHLG